MRAQAAQMRTSLAHNIEVVHGLGLMPADVHSCGLPSWLTTCSTELELQVRFVDFWGGGTSKTHELRTYLERLGFDASTSDFSQQQTGVSCGIVAAMAVVAMRLAQQDWRTADVTGAAAVTQVRRANERQDLWADHRGNGSNSDSRFSMEQLQADPGRTRFITNFEVERLERGPPPPPEAPGPPCARCGHSHVSSTCPLYSQPCFAGSDPWLTVGTFDAVRARIVRDLHAVATGVQSPAMSTYCVSNTELSATRSGQHWFVRWRTRFVGGSRRDDGTCVNCSAVEACDLRV